MQELKTTFGIVITAQSRHGALWRARQKYGSSKALGNALGISQSKIGDWINLKSVPAFANPDSQFFDQEERDKWEAKLWTVVGETVDDLWPPELQIAIKDGTVSRKVEFAREVALTRLGTNTAERLLLPSPEKVLEAKDLQQQFHDLMAELNPRLRHVLSLRMGFDGEALTLGQTGAKIG